MGATILCSGSCRGCVRHAGTSLSKGSWHPAFDAEVHFFSASASFAHTLKIVSSRAISSRPFTRGWRSVR